MVHTNYHTYEGEQELGARALNNDHARDAAAFHRKWNELEPELSNMAVAAQALASLERGSGALSMLLEEVNDLLIEGFELANPISLDEDGVLTSGMLELWRDTLFDKLITK